jgi:predicted nicotinamide N-methyase
VDDVVEEVVGVAGRDLAVLRPRDAEALLSEEAFAHEEFLPYWAELWPSALALARAVAARALHGGRVVELGCGLALPSIVAAQDGGRVLATDWAPDAIAFAQRNARHNGVALDTAVESWTDPQRVTEQAPWDLVLGSDLL